MKEKVLMFIIGLLLGAVLATGAYYLFANNSCDQSTQMNGGEPPALPNGESGTPPEKPDGDNTQPPEIQNNSNTESSN